VFLEDLNVMKAAILEKIDAPLAVRDVELTALKFGQVLVKVLVSGLCGAQLHEIRGYKDNLIWRLEQHIKSIYPLDNYEI